MVAYYILCIKQPTGLALLIKETGSDFPVLCQIRIFPQIVGELK